MNLALFDGQCAASGFDCGPLFKISKRRAPKRHARGLERFNFIRRHRTPEWANVKAIRLIYARSRQMSLISGMQYSVDHITPLNHPLVCGLHVEHNLRVIPLADNIRKGAAWWPDMWNEQLELEMP